MATTSMRMSARMWATMSGVDHVRLAGIAPLSFVIFAGEVEGLLEAGQIVLGAVLADLELPVRGTAFRRDPRAAAGDGYTGDAGGIRGHCNSILAGHRAAA